MCRVTMCRVACILFLPVLWQGCSARRQVTARQTESRQQVVDVALCDTLRQQQATREHEETTWQVEVVREWVDGLDSLSAATGHKSQGVERWHIRAVTTRDMHRNDTLHAVESLAAVAVDSVETVTRFEETSEQRRGSGTPWHFYVLMLLLSIVSVGFIVKR